MKSPRSSFHTSGECRWPVLPDLQRGDGSGAPGCERPGTPRMTTTLRRCRPSGTPCCQCTGYQSHQMRHHGCVRARMATPTTRDQHGPTSFLPGDAPAVGSERISFAAPYGDSRPPLHYGAEDFLQAQPEWSKHPPRLPNGRINTYLGSRGPRQQRPSASPRAAAGPWPASRSSNPCAPGSSRTPVQGGSARYARRSQAREPRPVTPSERACHTYRDVVQVVRID